MSGVFWYAIFLFLIGAAGGISLGWRLRKERKEWRFNPHDLFSNPEMRTLEEKFKRGLQIVVFSDLEEGDEAVYVEDEEFLFVIQLSDLSVTSERFAAQADVVAPPVMSGEARLRGVPSRDKKSFPIGWAFKESVLVTECYVFMQIHVAGQWERFELFFDDGFVAKIKDLARQRDGSLWTTLEEYKERMLARHRMLRGFEPPDRAGTGSA